MCDTLRACLDAGCFGLSMGFDARGLLRAGAEIVALLRVVAERGAMATVHTRSQREFTAAIAEMAAWCRQAEAAAGAPGAIRLQIDHLKRSGQRCWGTMDEPLGLIERLRAEGLDIAFDVYPTSRAASTFRLAPGVGMRAAPRRCSRARPAETRARLREERRYLAGGARQQSLELDFDRILITDVGGGAVARSSAGGCGGSQTSAAGPGRPLPRPTHRGRGTCERGVLLDGRDDMRRALAHPLGAVATDGLASPPRAPRTWATHTRAPRHLPATAGEDVRHEKLLPLEEAVRKCTWWRPSVWA